MCKAPARSDTKSVLLTSFTKGRVGARASCASEVGAGLAGGSFGASAFFGYFLGMQKVTRAKGKNNGSDKKQTLIDTSDKGFKTETVWI
jgi:hypothetical protein